MFAILVINKFMIAKKEHLSFNSKEKRLDIATLAVVLIESLQLKLLKAFGPRPVTLLEWDMFSCEFCEIFKNTFFSRTLLATASKSISRPLVSVFFV